MFLVGITGGIASGKSTVSAILKNDFKCTVVDADVIARDILLPHTAAYNKVAAEFGPVVINKDGTLNREALGSIVFNDHHKRKRLNSITHWAIGKVMLFQIIKGFLKGNRFIILDVPLLIESKFWLPFLKYTVVISCSYESQLSRLILRNSFTKGQAQARISSQMPLTEKSKHATNIIDNNASILETYQQVAKFYSVLKQTKTMNLYECLGILIVFLIILYALF